MKNQLASTDFYGRRRDGVVRLLLALALLSFTSAGAPARALGAQAPREQAHEGEVEVLHEDRDVGSRYVYFLNTARERLELRFSSEPPPLVSGDRVRARGVRANGVLAISSGGSVETLAAALPNTFGPQRTLVILVNFASNPVQPYTLASAQSVVNTTSNFDLENSFEQTSLDATVVGWYTVDFSSASCAYSTIASLADQAAAANGVDVSSYPRRVYAFPSFSACNWWGLGTVGGNPSKAWINGSFQLRVLGHEMGHNFGLYHSHSLSCTSTVCSSSDYGDGWDIMGSSSGHFNAFQKEQLGWLDYGVSPPITTVEADGVYWIAPYESQDSDPKALKILKSTDAYGNNTYYYVEYRAGRGFDSSVSSAVVLHSGSELTGNSSYLWDLDQETATADWILNVGQTYEDPVARVTVNLLSMDSAGASVSVTFAAAPCVPANPTVTLSPSAAWVIGASANYTVTVRNNDSGPCAPTSFNLSSAVPAGWTALFGSLAAIPAGSSADATLLLTAPIATLDGSYNFTVTATNAANAAYSASTGGIEVCCSGVLAVTATTNQSSYRQNSWVTVTVGVAAGQTPVSGASVTVNIIKDGIVAATLTGTTSASGNAVLRYKLPRRNAVGAYQVAATSAASGYSGSAPIVSFAVTR